MSSTYKSLVFFDLEATDLPHSRPAITELSFVAVSLFVYHPFERNHNDFDFQCSSDHFENCSPGTPILPRVLYKLTLCVNPMKKIVPEAVVITGLDNFLLQDEDVFNAKKVRLLSTFLENLQQPVCLVAHNGNVFDFPLLARTLNEMNTVSPAIFHSSHFNKIIYTPSR